jgi:hypothetical protein
MTASFPVFNYTGKAGFKLFSRLCPSVIMPMAESLQDTLASFGNIMFSKFVFYSIRLVWKINGTMQGICNATLSFWEIHKAAGKISLFCTIKKLSLDKHPGLSDSQDSIRSRGAGNHAWIASPLHSESAAMPESLSPAVCIGAGSHCLPTGEP